MNIKIGDIFYENRGIAHFYQVVKVYESGRVKIREIDKEETKSNCGYEMIAKPIKDKFLPKRDYQEFEKKYVEIMDNDKGVIKKIDYYKNNPIIEFKTSIADLWKGNDVISNYYNIWMK